MTPVATGSQKILTAPYLIDADGNFVKYDGLGDGDNSLVGLMGDDGTTIQNNYLRDEYLATSERFVKWYENGWVYKDGANYKETQEALIAGGACFGLFKCFATGAESSLAGTCGYDMTIINIDESPEINTGMLRKFSWAVPVTATEPEAAVKFMNLLFTDAEVLNLLTWGSKELIIRFLKTERSTSWTARMAIHLDIILGMKPQSLETVSLQRFGQAMILL